MRLPRFLLALLVLDGSCALTVFEAHTGSGVHARQATLIWRSRGPCAGYDCLQENVYPVPDSARRGEGVILIRVCSDRPLALAIATASVPPTALADWMRQMYNLPSENVVVGRTGDRATPVLGYAATELWWAASRDDLPPSLDAVAADRIVIEHIGRRPGRLAALPFEGAPHYVDAVHRLIAELRMRAKAVGVVNGYYLDRPTRAMAQRVQRCKRLLARSGLDRARYVIRIVPWPGGWTSDPPDPHPVMPSVALYEVLSDRPASRGAI